MQKPPVWKHFAAFLYDIFPVLGILILTSFIVLLARNGQEVDKGSLWFGMLIFFEIAIYYIFSWKKGGQTIGMRAWKIKISCINQKTPVSWNQAIIRFVFGVLSTLLLGAGIFWKLAPGQNTWMDRFSQTRTLSEPA